MENFVVSARKYRPGEFDAVVGQSHITTTLRNAIKSNHLAQAFLFCGPRGVGKTTCARLLAKTINCENVTPEIEPCNQCHSCQNFINGQSLNIVELDAASNNSVEDIRNLIEQVRYPPQHGRRKVYIIDEVHMLSNQAFNAFLKTLEEPPSYAIFILATTEKHKIIPTILSRCQIFDFNRITVRDTAVHLAQIAEKEEIKAEYEALHLIAQKADGALRDALSLFDLMVTYAQGREVTYSQVVQNLHILDYDYYFRIVEAMLAQKLPDLFLIYDDILKKGFDGHNFLIGFAEHLRNLLMSKEPQTVQLLDVPENIRAKFIEQSQQTSPSFLLTALSIVSDAEIHYKSSKNPRLLAELTLIKIAHIPSAVSLTALVEELKKKTELKSLSNSESQKNNPTGQSVVQTASQNALKITPKISVQAAKEEPNKQENGAQSLQNEPIEKLTTSPKADALTTAQNFFFSQNETLLQKYASRDLEISPDNKIIFRMENALEESFLLAKRDFLLKEMKEATGRVFEMIFEMKKSTQPVVRRLDTNSAKLQYLLGKNPFLSDFIQKLGLSPD